MCSLNDRSIRILIQIARLHCRVSDKIPLRKDVSYDSIELCDENADVILLKIIGYDGRVAPLRLMSATTIQEVKCQALRELVPSINDQGTSKVFDYKLLKPTASMLALNESLTISQSGLSDCGKCSGLHGNDGWYGFSIFMLQMNFC